MDREAHSQVGSEEQADGKWNESVYPCSCHSYLVKEGRFLGGQTPTLAGRENRQLELSSFFDKQMDVQWGPMKTLSLRAASPPN